MNKLAEWLANNLPPDDNEETLIHGDFRIDNIIFHPTEVFEACLCMFSSFWSSIFFVLLLCNETHVGILAHDTSLKGTVESLTLLYSLCMVLR